ncbi:IclR family transcriptional regulator [Citricoccus sp. SGAir0253]|uniref:IclR family transcriptional regulator n=1 Tax=Citricoccus sp. SGAir0253 TaxID=2567881 RepID=UPI0010CCFADB|nr:IclR family transcriptional regulator [Citricoccus sp. SGAir0253]QCU78929.1 IclR family transcriptional regulator [Citricoccus sp. SGAir0253]
MAGGSRDPGRSVTDKVLSVLTAFEKERRALGLSEIAVLADLPVSTAHRLVGELTEWGFLSRTPHGRYQLGLRIWELAQNVGRQLRETARPFVQDLYSLTGENAQLAVRDGSEVLYIDRVYGTKRVPRASRVGGRLPMHSTAVGKVLLAYEEPWVLEAYLNLELAAATPRTITAPGRLAAEIAQVREQGFAETFEEIRVGACSIAVPVFHTGRIGAALGLVIPSEQSGTMQKHLPALRAVSARIERATAHIPLETLLDSHQVFRR